MDSKFSDFQSDTTRDRQAYGRYWEMARRSNLPWSGVGKKGIAGWCMLQSSALLCI